MERRDQLWGRRKGKKLSPRRTGLMDTLYPALALGLDQPAPEAIASLFTVPVTDIHLEIGFGGGERLLSAARINPAEGYIGVEPFQNGLAKAVASIADGNDRNVRLFGGDAADLLAWLPPASLVEVALFYPDPWPKRRHWKRRFVSGANLDRIARVLRPGGQFRFASDVPSYVEWTLMHMLPRKDFAWTAKAANDWRLPFPDWTETRYEAKARREGRISTYLVYRRTESRS